MYMVCVYICVCAYIEEKERERERDVFSVPSCSRPPLSRSLSDCSTWEMLSQNCQAGPFPNS